jgi:antitoxin PrlF
MTHGFMTTLDGAPGGRRKRGPKSVGIRSPDLIDVSRITSKGQITLPKTVRVSLGVAEGDVVSFRTVDGRIVIERDTQPEDVVDPAIAAFLDLIENDITERRGAAGDFPKPLMEAMLALTRDIEVDLDAEIDGAVAL